MNTFSVKIAWADDTVGLSENSIDGRIADENPHLSTVPNNNNNNNQQDKFKCSPRFGRRVLST